MNDALMLVSAFALVLFFYPIKPLSVVTSNRLTLKPALELGLLIFLICVLFTASFEIIGDHVKRISNIAFIFQEWFAAFCFLAAIIVGFSLKKDLVFGLLIFSYVIYLTETAAAQSDLKRLVLSFGMSMGAPLGSVLLRGLEKRLVFSSPPKILEGLPILLWSAGLLALILGVFQVQP